MAEFLESIQAAGVVGAGGAGFPTHVKLNSKAEYLIINTAECEPLIESDKYLCRNFADDIVKAVGKTAEHLGAAHAVFAIKGEYENEIASLKAAAERNGVKVEFCEMPAFYPAGDEQTMVQLVTGRSIPERGLPLDVGAVVQNVCTMMNIEHALNGEPVVDKYLSITGAVAKPIMICVPVGTHLNECIAKAEINLPAGSKGYAVLVGGPMMGRIIVDKDEIAKSVVTKTTGNLAILPLEHYLVNRSQWSIESMKHKARSACIQCRMCTDLCPRYMIGHEIRPHLVMRNIWRENSIEKQGDEAYIASFGDALNCCDCGVCEMFSCPMGLSPRRMNQYFKQKFREKKLNKERNMHPEASRFINDRRVPTERLYARLGISQWHDSHVKPGETHISFTPDEVYIPFRQHIGKPAVPAVNAGDSVKRGDLLAAADGAVSANIHTGVNGVVESVDANGALIKVNKNEVSGRE
ncbi:MAG: 4Fe-4S dicluster domain-containing protein [Synergistaceae bacterium]|nr:4Fe-4S dicluster domain-containing protein [Synergistaceae bacterium]